MVPRSPSDRTSDNGETPRKLMLPAKIMLAFHFMWFDWHDMVTKVPVPSASPPLYEVQLLGERGTILP